MIHSHAPHIHATQTPAGKPSAVMDDDDISLSDEDEVPMAKKVAALKGVVEDTSDTDGDDDGDDDHGKGYLDVQEADKKKKW